MTSPIARLIDATVTCIVCNASGPPGTCDCHIRQQCPKCGKALWYRREAIDPLSAKTLTVECLACDPEQVGSIVYADRDGRELPI